MLQQLRVFLFVWCTSVLAAFSGFAHALIIVVDTSAITDANTKSAFQQAARNWESLISTNTTINIRAEVNSISSGGAATQAGTNLVISYEAYRDKLTDLASSRYDTQATALLNTYIPGPSVSFIGNDASGAVRLWPGSDVANTSIRLTVPLARALQLIPAGVPSGEDARITLNSASFPWDYDQRDGIAPGKLDLVGVLGHEMGHAMGFKSGAALAFVDPTLEHLTALDLFRYSSRSNGGARVLPDVSRPPFPSASDPFFALERASSGGLTPLRSFNTGTSGPEHWANKLGIMGTDGPPGSKFVADVFDLRALDVIGWDLRRDNLRRFFLRLISGSPVEVSTKIAVPEGDFIIQFAGTFESGLGQLSVLIGDTLLNTFISSITAEEMYQIEVDGGVFSGDQQLRFVYDGPTGTSFALGSIAAPGLSNGELENGLAGWDSGTSGSGAVLLVAVPEPMTTYLMLAGLVLVGYAVARRKRVQARLACQSAR